MGDAHPATQGTQGFMAGSTYHPSHRHTSARALAALSCALALLAASPQAVHTLQSQDAAVQPAQQVAPAEALAALDATETPRPARRTRPASIRVVRQADAPVHHASRLLAAFSQFSHLVARELAPIYHAPIAPGRASVACATPPPAAVRIPRVAALLPLPRDRVWIQRRQALAPPLA